MASFNRVIFMGNLTRDVETKTLQSQSTVSTWGMASNRKWKTQGGEDREEVCFIDVTAFGRVGEIVAQYCQKGSPLLVEGRLRYETWEDKSGGGKRSKLSITAENIQLLGGRSEDDSKAAGAGNGRAAPASKPDARPMQRRVAERPEPENPISTTHEFAEDDIPF